MKENWISVKDRLPETRGVLVTYRFGVGEAVFLDGKFRRQADWNQEIPDVTHWMPLPKPARRN